jgi:hypothetical protein
MGRLTNPTAGHQVHNTVHVMEMHGKIKKHNPVKPITEHINPKIYPRIKVTHNLPLGW